MHVYNYIPTIEDLKTVIKCSFILHLLSLYEPRNTDIVCKILYQLCFCPHLKNNPFPSPFEERTTQTSLSVWYS